MASSGASGVQWLSRQEAPPSASTTDRHRADVATRWTRNVFRPRPTRLHVLRAKPNPLPRHRTSHKWMRRPNHIPTTFDCQSRLHSASDGACRIHSSGIILTMSQTAGTPHTIDIADLQIGPDADRLVLIAGPSGID